MIIDLKNLLDEKADRYNSVEFIETDPISIPHMFSKKEDIEIAAFLIAIIAWGQRNTIIRNGKRLMDWMQNSPFDFIYNFSEKDLDPFKKFVHRTFNGIDCEYFMWALKNIYQKYGSLENAFFEDSYPPTENPRQAIINFRRLFFSLNPLNRTQKHIADPSKNASAKRINMFLRWMVRKDNKGVDFGIWQKIKPSQLVCPLDTHSGRVARKLGLLKRNSDDWKAVVELTENLSLFDPYDPIRYDFALFGMGVFEKF